MAGVVKWTTRCCFWAKYLVRWVIVDKHEENRDPGGSLGQYLRDRREHLGLSARAVARAVGVQDSTIMRLERGHYLAPAPDKLARIAATLELELADVYAKAGYAVPERLPGLTSYLNLRYPLLGESAVDELNAHLERLVTESMLEEAVR